MQKKDNPFARFLPWSLWRILRPEFISPLFTLIPNSYGRGHPGRNVGLLESSVRCCRLTPQNCVQRLSGVRVSTYSVTELPVLQYRVEALGHIRTAMVQKARCSRGSYMDLNLLLQICQSTFIS